MLLHLMAGLIPIVAGGGLRHAGLEHRATRIGIATAWKTGVATLLAPRVYQALTARLYDQAILSLAQTSGLAIVWNLQLWWEKYTKDGDVAKRNASSCLVLTFAPMVFYCIQCTSDM